MYIEMLKEQEVRFSGGFMPLQLSWFKKGRITCMVN
jgi:hypothetical protein